MKKRIVVLCALLVLVTASVFAATTSLRFKAPVFVTSGGQSVDGGTVGTLLKRAKVSYTYEPSIDPKKINWNSFETLIIVIGGSGKGLGSAGITVSDEVTRVQTLLDAAKKNNKKIITMHIGGQDRRGANSAPFLPFCSYGELMIVNSNGNSDGYFTKLASDNKIEFIEISKNTEMAAIFTEIFGK